MRGLDGKRVLITGGASGIGRAAAERFLEEGAEVCIVDRLEEAEARPRLGDRLTQAGAKVDYLAADVTSPASLAPVQAWMDSGVDVLINNAGITRDGVSWKQTWEQWSEVIEVNLSAVFRLCQMATVAMKARQKGGVLLNAASVVAHGGNFGQANYVASKAGVIGLTKTLARELGRFNIRVNAVAPGFVQTDMTARVPDEVLEGVAQKTPLGRLGRPEEIAAMYAFLASDDASFVTGAVMNTDGGLAL